MVQEAVRDAGVMPQYLRVDFLVDKQGLVMGLDHGIHLAETSGFSMIFPWDEASNMLGFTAGVHHETFMDFPCEGAD